MQDWQWAMSVLTYILFTPHLHLQCKPLLLQRRRGRTPPRPYLNPTTSGYGHAVPIPELARKATRACRSCPVPTPRPACIQLAPILGHPAPNDPEFQTLQRPTAACPARGRGTGNGHAERRAAVRVVVYSRAESAVTRTSVGRAGPKAHLAQSATTTHGGRGPPALSASDRSYAASFPPSPSC